MELQLVLSLFCTIISCITLIVVLIRYKNDENNPDINKKRFYWDFFVPQYLDGSFTFKDNKIELKTGRLQIKQKYDAFRTDDKYKEYARASIDEATPSRENKFAHRLSVILNRIGQATFAGDLPLYNVLSISSKMILDDWEKSKALINANILDYSAIGYNRKFFRWLAFASCMYIINHDSTYKSDRVVGYIKQLTYIHDDSEKIDEKLLKIFQRLSKSDYNAVAIAIVGEIDDLQNSDDEIIGKLVLRDMNKLKKSFSKKMKSLQ